MDVILQFYLPFSLVLSFYLTTRSFRRRVHSAHFPIFSQKHLASELSVANSRDISVDALCSLFIHRNVVVRYSSRIRSRKSCSWKYWNRPASTCFLLLRPFSSRTVRVLVMLRKNFSFLFFSKFARMCTIVDVNLAMG